MVNVSDFALAVDNDAAKVHGNKNLAICVNSSPSVSQDAGKTHMHDPKLSYLAGLIDGEGSICISTCRRWHWTNAAKTSRKQYQHFGIYVNVTNTAMEMMRWLVTNFGGQYYPKARKNPKKWAPGWTWEVRGKANRKQILLSVLPYLVVKKAQALLALEYLELGDWSVEEREKIRIKMVALNRRGPSETNTLDAPAEQGAKIESELTGDREHEPSVTPAS